jgi:RNA polymerase sigma-70 factor (ECF subfamily)
LHVSQKPEPRRPDVFATTRWSLVAAASTGEARTSLAELCVRYWYPVYAYARRCGHPPTGAQDLTLAFFHWLVTERLRSADPRAHGRFREFVLHELNRFRAESWRGERVENPAEGLLAPLPPDLLEQRHASESTDAASPEMAFQRGFALEILARAFNRLRREALQAGRLPMYEALEPYLTAEPPAGQLEALSAPLHMGSLALVMALKRLRQRFRELVDEELIETVSNPADLESERATLREVLGA